MKILSTTMVYPTPAAPVQGIFVQQRLRALARLAEVRVVVPQPWFPGWSRGVRTFDVSEPVAAHYRRMPYLPGLAKCLDGMFFARCLRRALREIRQSYPFDLIDAHFEYPDGVGAVCAAKELGLPVCVTLRGKLHSQVRYRLRRPQIARMLREADGLVAVASSLRDAAMEVAGRLLAIRVIPNGVDDTVFRRVDPSTARAGLRASSDSPLPLAGGGQGEGVGLPAGRRDVSEWALHLPDGPRYVVSVGHMQELKGFHRLVEVLPAVRRAAGDVRLLLIGGPTAERDYEPRLRARVHELGLDGAVEMLGRQPQDRINLYLNAADCFALATRMEGCCNAIQEALCAGAPVITTAVGGNPELVNSPDLGTLVPFGDAGSLRDAILAALRRTWDRERIAAVGRQRSWDQVARETLAYCEEILSRTKPLRPQPIA